MKTILGNLHKKVDTLMEDLEFITDNINDAEAVLQEVIEEETVDFIQRNRENLIQGKALT